MEHLEKDMFQYQCPTCQFVGKSLKEMAAHEASKHNLPMDASKYSNALVGRLERYYYRTLLIFKNGLILYKQNLLNTSLDDRKAFWPFRKQLADQKLEESRTNLCPPELIPVSNRVTREAQLNQQRAKCNNLRVTGILRAPKDELPDIFRHICEAIGITDFAETDIANVDVLSSAVIFHLGEKDIKSRILTAWHKTSQKIKLKQLTSVTFKWPCINLSRIQIQRDLTPFFLKLWRFAEKAKNKNQIHSFRVLHDGLHIKPSKNCKKTFIVWSNADITNCIQGNFQR